MADHAADDGAPEHETDPRPQPVTDEAVIAARILGVLGALLLAAQAAGFITADQAATWQQVGAALCTAVLALAAVIVPVWRAHRARDVVTPIADPVGANGEPLVAVSALPLIRDAAAANVPLPVGEPEPTPWDEDSSVVRGEAA